MNTAIQILTIITLLITIFVILKTTLVLHKYEQALNTSQEPKKKQSLRTYSPDVPGLERVGKAFNIEPETVEQRNERLRYEAMDETEKRLYDAQYNPDKVKRNVSAFVQSTKQRFISILKNKKP